VPQTLNAGAADGRRGALRRLGPAFEILHIIGHVGLGNLINYRPVPRHMRPLLRARQQAALAQPVLALLIPVKQTFIRPNTMRATSMNPTEAAKFSDILDVKMWGASEIRPPPRYDAAIVSALIGARLDLAPPNQVQSTS
jgi:hypothetical protein